MSKTKTVITIEVNDGAVNGDSRQSWLMYIMGQAAGAITSGTRVGVVRTARGHPQGPDVELGAFRVERKKS